MSDWSSDVCSSDLVNNPNGEPAGLPVLETWDGAKRYLDDLEFDTNSPFIARPQGMTSDTRAIDLTRRQLLNELDQQVPQYKEARKAFEGPTQATIGRAHVCTPVTTAHLVCPLLIEIQNRLFHLTT